VKILLNYFTPFSLALAVPEIKLRSWSEVAVDRKIFYARVPNAPA
jgi:hypothetical protein